MEILFWLLYITFLSILNCTNSNANCLSYGVLCDPTSAVKCCGELNSCRKESRDLFFCTKKVLLGSLCRIDEDCEDILHSKCSEKKQCACKANYLQINITHCAPLLGEFCWKNEKCAAENAVCIQSECQCKPQFIQLSPLQCVAASLDETCRNDEDCKSIRFAECSEHKKCGCISNFMEFNSTTCVPLLRGSCSVNDDCYPEYSICSNHYCRCENGYFKISAYRCGIPLLATLPCQNDENCDELIEYTICGTENKCECKTNYIPRNDSKCVAIELYEHCYGDSDCAVENSWCIDNKCECINGFDEFNRSCKVPLGKFCQNNNDCKSITNSICSSKHNICVCDERNFALNLFECAPTIDGFCTSDEDCQFSSSYCFEKKCKCLPNFAAVSNTHCIEVQSLYSCNGSLDCSDAWHTKCSEDKLCICNSNNTVENYPTCLPNLGGYCWKNDQCKAPNSKCLDYNCKCQFNYLAVAENLCVPIRSRNSFSYF